MKPFSFSSSTLQVERYRTALEDPAAGGYASFEGWVRNHNEGHAVTLLEYEAFEALANKEGERIVADAIRRFGVINAICVHRVGSLAIGDLAVWVGVSSRHRAEAFAACRYIIDEVKHRVPIWKKEHYVNGDSGWVNCERCAEHAHEHEHTGHAHSSAIQPPLTRTSCGLSHEGRGEEKIARQADRPLTPSPLAGEGRGEGPLTPSPLVGEGRGEGPLTPSPLVGEGRGEGLLTPSPLVGEGRGEGPLVAPDYSRQIALRDVGAAGQEKLRAARVLVIGAGGLGVPVLNYLAGAGVGTIGIAEGDTIDASNLHRQPLYSLSDVGKPKVEVAAQRLRALNPDVHVHTHERIVPHNAAQLLAQYDLVVECSDNFATKFLVNDAAVQTRRPAIFASVYQYEGQLQTYRPDSDTACLRCLWPQATRDGLVGNCAEAGVLGPVPGVFGSLQALEALKLILNLPGQLRDEMLLVDLLTLEQRKLKVTRRSDCPHDESVRFETTAQDLEVTLGDLRPATVADYTLIDVREPREVSEAPIAQTPSRQIPLAALLADSAPLDPERKYLLICARGARSRAAAEHLRSHGFRHAYSLRGGLSALGRV